MKITLVRHGQSLYNAGLTDFLDSGLTPLGQKQAEQTGIRLKTAGLTRLFASPLRRTLETIRPTSLATGLSAEVEARLCEFFSNDLYRQFPGMSAAEITREFPFVTFGETFPDDIDWWPQEIETNAHLIARAETMRDALLERYANTDEHLLIVSHADTVGRLTEAFLRGRYAPDPPFPDNCGVTLLHVADQVTPAQTEYWNDISHLHV